MLKLKKYCGRYVLIFSICLLQACGTTSMEKLNRYIAEVKARPGGKIEPIPTYKPLPAFNYPELTERRNPFKPLVQPQLADEFAPDSKRPKQPLEAYPLDSLKFVGTLEQGQTMWALISRPNGQITRAQVGNYMGQNFGKIISITETSLLIEERLRVDGKWEKKITTFTLKTGQ